MNKNAIIFAHRGASHLAPENTLAAFRIARDIQATGIELDVHLSKDGTLVVIHDYELNRTARNPDGSQLKTPVFVAAQTLKELNNYDVGIAFGHKYAGEKIPTLKQAMDLISPDIMLDIEIKAGLGHSYKQLARVLADFLYEYSKSNLINKVIVSSFNPFALRIFKSHSRRLGINVPTALLFGNLPQVPWFFKRGQGRFIHKPDIMKPLYSDIQNKKDLSGWGRAKKPILAWTVDDVDIAADLIDKNIYGLVTNVPEIIVPQAKNMRQ